MHRRQRGFTLVELATVIVIIAILAAVSIVGYGAVQRRAAATAASDAAFSVAEALTIHEAYNSGYPSTLAEIDITDTDKISYKYTASGGGFCVTATSRGTSYFTTGTDVEPEEGACPGHGAEEEVEDTSMIIANFDTINPAQAGTSPTVGVTHGYAGNGAGYTGSTHKSLWYTDEPVTYLDNQTISARVRVDSGATGFVGVALSAGAGNQGFQFLIDNRNSGTGGSSSIQIRHNASTTPLARFTQSGLIQNGRWYRIEAQWNSTSPHLTMRLYDDSENLVHQLTSTDSSRLGQTLYPGLYGYGNISFDDFEYR